MNVPRRLTDCCRSQLLVGRSPIVPPIPTPALLTRTSRPPKRSTCAATRSRQASSSRTSTDRVSASSSAPADSSRSTFLAASVNPYPSALRARAIARPMPDDPPVTRADFTVRFLWHGAVQVKSPPWRTTRARSLSPPLLLSPEQAAPLPQGASSFEGLDSDRAPDGAGPERRLRREVLGREARDAAARIRAGGVGRPARRA